MTLLEPQKTAASLVYMGYPGDTSTAFQVTRRKKYDQKKQRSQRGVIQCFVFGSKKSGKSAILDALIGRYVFVLSLVVTRHGSRVTIVSTYLYR